MLLKLIPSIIAPPQCPTHFSPVHTPHLLASLDANLSEQQGDKQANVPCDEVQPELVPQGRSGGEFGQLLLLGERSGTAQHGTAQHSTACLSFKDSPTEGGPGWGRK